MSEFLEYTPVRLPTMTGPAWPDNTRNEIGYTPRLPTNSIRLPKKQTATKKKKSEMRVPTEPVEETVSVVENVPAETTQPNENSRGTFFYQKPREVEPRGEFVDNPVEPSNEEPGNWFSRMIAPPKDELEAANNGMRWHWALEHRFMPPGSKWNETVWQGADRENAWLAQMLRQAKTQENQGMMTPMAHERMRSTLSNQWSKFINSVKNGNFDAYGGTTESAQKWADDFKKYYDSVLGEGASTGLEPVPDVLGKRNILERKTASDALTTLNKLQTFDERIQDWLASGDFQNPVKSRLIRNELDKLAQNFSATLGGDSKNMSEEEKKRIQILYLPQNAMDNVHETVRRWRQFLTNIMNSASAKEWSQSNRGKVKEMQAALATEVPEDVDTADRGSLADMAATMGTFTAKALSDRPELPHDVAAALQAGLKTYETYMDNMVLAANVDPAVAHHMAEYIHNEVSKFYNKYLEDNRRPERWDYKFSDMDYSKLSQEVPADALLEPPTFIAPTTLGPAKGGDASSNPASKGENKKSTPKSPLMTDTKGRKGI